MQPIDMNSHFPEIVYLTVEDLNDIDDSPHGLDLFFGPHLLFRFPDGGAILQHSRPATTAFIDACNARDQAQTEWARARDVLRAEISARDAVSAT